MSTTSDRTTPVKRGRDPPRRDVAPDERLALIASFRFA
jgi:hypothetical protein